MYKYIITIYVNLLFNLNLVINLNLLIDLKFINLNLLILIHNV